MRRFLTVLAGAAVLGVFALFTNVSRQAVTGADPMLRGEVREAVGRSIAYLTKECEIWVKKQHCASCHHVPMMVWALNEARRRNYPVNDKVLAEIRSWAIAEKNHPRVFQNLPLDMTRTETDYLGPLLMALAVGADNGRDEATEKSRQRLLAHVVTQLTKEGAWNANTGGRPPVHASKDVQTSWFLLALSAGSADAEAKDPWRMQRASAADWLDRNRHTEDHYGIAMRLLVQDRLGKPAGEAKQLLESFLRLQSEDGGWSQTRQMKSDAFATGLSLYVLSSQQGAGVDGSIQRAQTFLLQNQQPDGSWSMTSRSAEPPGPGPATYLEPIKVFGTAWATMGLVRSGPENGAAKR